MTIERRIRITSLALILYAVGIVLILFWSSHQVGRGITGIETASQIDRSAFMLVVLMKDYLEQGSKRILEQWEQQNERLGRILRDGKPSESLDAALLEDVRKSYQALNHLYPRLIEVRASTGTGNRSQDATAMKMLTGLMFLQLEQLVHAGNDLSNATQALTLKKRNFVGSLIVGLGVSVVIVILVNIHLIRKSVVKPLHMLSNGAEKIGLGEFDYVAEIKGDDEVGKLARAFNTMIAGLQKRTTALKKAKDELELRIEERTAAYETAHTQNELLEAVQRAQTQFISHANPEELFGNLLHDLLVLTKSEFGFIDEVLHAEDGRPYLRIRSITDISWDEESRKIYQQFRDEKGLDFPNIRGLWGTVVQTGEPVISNDPANHPRRGGIPEGHPPIHSFLGVPFHSDGNVIGMAGIANRPGGYTQQLVDFLQPYVTTCANIIDGCRNENRRREAEEALREAKGHLEIRVRERTVELEQINRALHEEIAERRRAEGQIIRAKEEWERTFDAITDPIMVLDEQHKIVKANQAMAGNLGISPASAVGLSCYSAVHGSSGPPPFCPHARLLADGQPHSEEIYEKRLGAIFHVSVSPLYAPDGTLVGSVHYMRDITERKQAENIMRARLRLVNYAASHSMDELLQATLDEVEALTGSSIGFYHFLEPDQKTLLLQNWSTRTLQEMCTAEGKGVHYDIDNAGVWVDCVHERRPVIHNDYSALPHRKGLPPGHADVIRELVVPVMRGDRIVAVLGVGNKSTDYIESDIETVLLMADLAWDITERKRAEQAVKAERQRLYDVLETLPVYVCLLDADYRMTFANRNFRENFGESRGRRCHDFLFDRTEPCETCETYTVMKTREPHHWYWTGPNGRDYDIYDFPFTDIDGSFLILEMGIDITERNQAEDALKQTLADLARSNADLEQFAYVASHDLQEPLRNVASCMQLLEKGYKNKLGQDADKLMEYAVDSVVRMKSLIQDLLAYSRVSTTGKPPQRTDCEEVLEQTLSNLSLAVKETGALVTRDPLPTVMADSTQLIQVFQNLIGNALKFRGVGPPQVHVRAVKDGREWVFSVKDNGIGIESRHLDRIFVIFQRLNKRSEYSGTGMGLAIVKKIVERHRGRIWVESEPGKGTTFYFTIPVKESII